MNSLIEENPNRKPNPESNPEPMTPPVETLFYLKEGMIIEKRDFDLYTFAATTKNDDGLICVFWGSEYLNAKRLLDLGLIELVSQHHDGNNRSKYYSMYRATPAGKLLYQMFENLIW